MNKFSVICALCIMIQSCGVLRQKGSLPFGSGIRRTATPIASIKYTQGNDSLKVRTRSERFTVVIPKNEQFTVVCVTSKDVFLKSESGKYIMIFCIEKRSWKSEPLE